MASILKHLRSSTANKRPTASGLSDGQIAINTASGTPALFFKDNADNIVKVGPVHVGSTAPNTSPAGSAGNSTGELWVDDSLTTKGLKYYSGSAFINLTPSGTTSTAGLVELATPAETQAGTDGVRAVTPSGLQSKISDSTSTTSSTTIASATAVKSAYDLANAALPKTGGTVTGEIVISPSGSLAFEGSTDDSFETRIAVVDPTADRTITLPNITGTVITTGDTGTVTSTMITDGTIVNADINASAAIALSKLAIGALPSAITVSSTNIVDGTIVNADINASAAIAGTKIDPAFGSNNITTDSAIVAGGTNTAVAFIPTSSIIVPPNGLYSPSANKVAISTNGTERLFVDASGNVGIGTSNPDARLRVTESSIGSVAAQANDIAVFERNSGAGYLKIYSPNNQIGGIAFGDPDDLFIGAIRYDHSDNNLNFYVNNNEAARIDSSGRLLVGASSALGVSSSTAAVLEVETTGIPLSVVRNSADATGPILALGKSRGTTPGSLTAVVDGDILGEIRFAGADGTTRSPFGGSIQCRVNGTPGTNDMPGRLVFSTTADGASSPTERMRIGANGAVMFDKTVDDDTTAGTRIVAGGLVSIVRDGNISLLLNRLSSNGSIAVFRRSGTTVGSISVTTTATAYNTSSDYRLKENVTAVTDGITRLQQLKPSRFNFISDPDTTVDGFLAHEVQTIVPEAITGEKDAVDADGNPEYQGIDQSKLVPLLTAALQEAVAKIESLEARLTAAGM